MGKRFIQFFENIGRRAIAIAVILYLAIILTKSMQGNVKVKKQIDAQKKEIAQLQDEINTKKQLLIYYQSPAYYELAARQQMNMQLDGEHVIILSPPPQKAQAATIDEGNITPTGTQTKNQKPNYLLWWEYHFSQ